MDAPYTYELAVGHPDQQSPNTYYVCTVLHEPQSSAWQMQNRASTHWRRGFKVNSPAGGTVAWDGAPASPSLPFSYRYIIWHGPAGAFMFHVYLRDPKTIDFSTIGMAPYERETAASQLVDAFEKAGWTILCVSGDVQRK